jgi:cytochrome c oxidase subunit 3
MPDGLAVHLAHQFDDDLQQHEAATLGMWTFLATEVMFFGGALAAYTVYRYVYPQAFAEGSAKLHESLGAINTAVLLTSSFSVALAVHFAEHLKRRGTVIALLVTIALGLAFLSIKGYEYSLEYHDKLVPGINFSETGAHARQIQLFMIFYFLLTLIHATHMIIGITLLTILTIQVHRNRPGFGSAHTVEMMGLYWHFVDIVWIFLLPLLYLVR